MIRCKLIERSVVGSALGTADVGRAVSGEALTIGRAASCKVYLPDPSIRLDHASIQRAEDGFLYLQASGPVFIDQKLQASCKLEVGQSISIGPYAFHLEALRDGPQTAVADLTLLYSVDEAGGQAGQGASSQPTFPGTGSFFRRRWLAWLFALLIAIFCSALPVWNAYHAPGKVGSPIATMPTSAWGKLDTFWNPGRISSAHQNFGNECKQCHDKPFERVSDASCQSCHKDVGGHIPDKGLEHTTFQGQRCASCHKDHQGSGGMKTVDALGCVGCHSDVKRYSAQSTLDNLSDFADSHPAFRLSILQADASNKAGKTVRLLQKTDLKNSTGLKFPHDIHLAKAGIKSPQGPVGTQGRVVLGCKNCHAPDAAGVRFEPVKMEQHCQGCHQLAVDPQVPQRQVPHGTPQEVARAVRDIYATLAVDRFPAELVTFNSFLQRPGSQPVPAIASSAGRWVDTQTSAALVSMLENPKGVCLTCHLVTPMPKLQDNAANWEIAPVFLTQHWLPKSKFSHAFHKNADCSDCHAAKSSKESADVLIPDLASCRDCHTGLHPDKNKVVSTCDSCHSFHAAVEHPIFKEAARVP